MFKAIAKKVREMAFDKGVPSHPHSIVDIAGLDEALQERDARLNNEMLVLKQLVKTDPDIGDIDRLWVQPQRFTRTGYNVVTLANNASVVDWFAGNFIRGTFTRSRTVTLKTPPRPGFYYFSFQLTGANISIQFDNPDLLWQYGVKPITSNIPSTELLCVIYDGNSLMASLSSGYRRA